MSKEAMKMALEALEYIDLTDNDRDFLHPHECYMIDEAIIALRQAIREAEEQAPWDAYDKAMAEQTVCDYCNHPLYAGTKCKNCGRVTEQAAIKRDLTPEQPAQQEPVAWINWCAATGKRSVSFECESELASQPLYEGITQNTQYHYSKFHSWFDSELHRQKYTKDHPAYLAAREAWNAANDAAQHRINRLNAEIEAWKVRFKIAEDALAKLNGPEQKPVATMWQHGETGRTRITMPGDITDCDARWFKVSDLYTSPPASKPWVGLTDEDIKEAEWLLSAIKEHEAYTLQEQLLVEGVDVFARAIEAKLRERNT